MHKGDVSCLRWVQGAGEGRRGQGKAGVFPGQGATQLL